MIENIAAAEAASLFGVEVVSEQAMKPMTIRVPLGLYAQLSAMSTQARCSRNTITIKVIQAGIEAIEDLLPPELRGELHEQQQANLEQLYQEQLGG
jgi:predicted DNA-binding protein